MKRPALVVLSLSLVIVGGLGWLAWTLFGGAGPQELATRGGATASAEDAPPEPAPAVPPAPLPVERTAAERTAPIAAPTAAPMPESYRRALSGVRGRLIEEDGRPVANLEVELLEVAVGGLMGDFSSAFAAGSQSGGLPIPKLTLGSTRSDEKGFFELHGALSSCFHGVGIDLGGARGTLRFVDRTLNSATVTDLGDLVLGPFVTWKGKVVDEEGKPVAGARVRATLLPPLIFQPGVADCSRVASVIHVRNWGNGRPQLLEIPESMRAWEAKLPFPTAKTAEDGAFELAGVPQGLTSVIADREGFCGSLKGPIATGKRDKDIGSITLSRGRTLSGTVVDAAGKPVAGAQIVGGAVIPGADLVIAFPATSDAEGRFALEHLADSAIEFLVAARRSPGDSWLFSERVDGSEPLQISLASAGIFDVKLAQKGGGVVPDARLWLQSGDADAPLAMAPPHEVAADRVVKLADGMLQVRDVPEGDYRLMGRAPGFAPAFSRIAVAIGGDANEATLEFTPAREIAVRVVREETREPIEYAEVGVTLAGDRMSPPFVVRRTDALGMARLPDLPTEMLALRAFHPAFGPGVERVDLAKLAAEPEPIEIALGPGATLHAFVHQSGRPLLEPMLFLLEPVVVVNSQGKVDASLDDMLPRFAVPGLDGTFTLTGLAPGERRWQLMPRLFAGEPQRAIQLAMEQKPAAGTERRGRVQLIAGKTAELDINIDPEALERPGRIVGVLRASDPSARFVIHVFTNQRDSKMERPQRDFTVAANERFTLEPITPGWVNVWVGREVGENESQNSIHQEYFELGAGEEHVLEAEFDLAIAELLLFERGEEPAEGVNVNFTPLDGEERAATPSPKELWAFSQRGGLVRATLPKPGRYFVRCSDPKRGRARLEIDVPTREPVRVELDRGVPCAGRIELTPDPGSEAEVWLSLQTATQDGRKGSDSWAQLSKGQRDFQIVGMDPGRYQAQLFTSNGKNATVDLELGANGDDHLVLRFTLR